MKIGMPPLGKLTRDDWHFILSLFLPLFIVLLMLGGVGRFEQPADCPKVAAVQPPPAPSYYQSREFLQEHVDLRCYQEVDQGEWSGFPDPHEVCADEHSGILRAAQ